MKVQELFEGVARTVTLERNQGLDFEARRLLPAGWRLECRADGFAFAGPWSDDWESTVWKLIHFLAYKSMIALRRSGAGNAMEYELVTCTERGTGFRSVFRSFPPGDGRIDGEVRSPGQTGGAATTGRLPPACQ